MSSYLDIMFLISFKAKIGCFNANIKGMIVNNYQILARMEISSDLVLLFVSFFIIASVYSSAGFGGGSSYIALLSLFPMGFIDLRMIALICNIAVVSGSSYLFFKHGYLKYKRIWPLILLSIPLAFVGGKYKIDENAYYILLGLSLLVASLIMLTQTQQKDVQKKLPKYSDGIIGGGIGLLSGLVGIGGGIFLSPVLYISNWGTPKVIAGTTALFILVNSIAGLTGQVVSHGMNLNIGHTLALVTAVVLGGQLGSRASIFRFNPNAVKSISAVLILIVAVRLLWTSLGI